MRSWPNILTMLLLLLPSRADSRWARGGVQVPGAGGDAQEICSDGSGGAFVAWRDARTGGVTYDDVFAQHLTDLGDLAPGFPSAGLPICTQAADQQFGFIAPDGQHGAILVWLDWRDLAALPDLYAQRITPSGGIAPGWANDGVPVTMTLVEQLVPSIVVDGAGGALFAWTDFRSGASEIYAQHLNGAGSVAEGWPVAGLPVCTIPSGKGRTIGVGDGSGGMLVFWSDDRAGVARRYDTYAQHITASGAIASGWPVAGLLISSRTALFDAVPDGAGGAYIGIGTPDPTYVGFFDSLFIVRIGGVGQVAPGWSPGGTVVCGAPDIRGVMRLAPDGLSGVYAEWDDLRGWLDGTPASIRAIRMRSDGVRALGWPENGLAISTASGYQYSTDLLSDGNGGAYFAFELESNYGYAYVQHLRGDATLAPGWTSDGSVLNLAGGANPRLAPDGSGGMIVAWWNGAIYAQHFVTDGVVATDLALVNADALPNRVVLVWQGNGAHTATASVERRTESTSWLRVGAPTLEGADRLRYEDRDVIGGSRYTYRLAYVSDGSQRFTSETWVDVPTAKLTLEGLRPNPATGPLSVSFVLPDASPASLELLDVGGRRLMRREVGSLGAGSHVVRLDEGASFAPGIYWVRLLHGGRSLLSRGAIVR